jgi:hypothetical protein
MVVSALLLSTLAAFSQANPPPTVSYPEPGPGSGAPAAAPAAEAPPPNYQPPPPNYQPPPPNYQPPPPNYQPPPPNYQPPPPNYQPPPNAQTGGAYPTNGTSTSRSSSASNPSPSDDGYNVGHSDIVEPPAPPPPKDDKGSSFPDMSVRVDPLNWIIYGRLGIELEAQVWKFITAELVPEFITSTQPPYMNLGSFPATLSQHSNGLGAMSGTSVGAGFWLNGKPFVGTVLRVIFTNYGYRYNSTPDSGNAGVGDEVTHTERRLVALLGSHSKWGPFTIAGAFGLGVELNRERRCFPGNDVNQPAMKDGCPKDSLDIRIPGVADPQNLYGGLHPAYLIFRLSLGFVF